MLKHVAALALFAIAPFTLAQDLKAPAKPAPTAAKAPAAKPAKNPQVKLMTNMGEIVLELDAAKAPKSVENFLGYVKDGYYNGTVFHRVIGTFMVQGGGYLRDLTPKQTKAPITNEADNGLSNVRGSIAMARTGEPHSATSQFFINVVDNQRLDYREKSPMGWGYAVFGKVVKGMDVVDRIKAVETGGQGMFPTDVPKSPIVIEVAEILK